MLLGSCNFVQDLFDRANFKHSNAERFLYVFCVADNYCWNCISTFHSFFALVIIIENFNYAFVNQAILFKICWEPCEFQEF